MLEEKRKCKNSCVICESENMVVLSMKSKFSELLTFICKGCGLVYTDSEMTHKEYSQFYKDDSYIKLKYPTIEKYYQEKSGTQILRAERSFSFADEFIKKDFNVLDIGCGFGAFIRLIKERRGNNNIVGIEPSVGVSTYAKDLSKEFGINIINCSFEDYYSRIESEKKEFDFIIMSHVLEHLLEPLENLRSVKVLLKKHGSLYLEVPNIMKYSGSIYGFLQLCHPYNFSPYTVNLLLEKLGFKIIKLSVGKEIKIIATPKKNMTDCNIDNSLFEINNNYERIIRRIRLNEIKYSLFSKAKALASKIIKRT